MQDAHPGVLGRHEGHTPKSCCPLRVILLISRKSKKNLMPRSFTSFTAAVPSTIIRRSVLRSTLAKP